MKLEILQKTYTKLQQQVEKAERLNQPIEHLVKQQIKILEEVHDEYVSSALAQNKNIENSLDFIGTKIKQLQAIASLCKKIGLPTEKYDKQIREIRIKSLGVDFVNERYK
ncbi:hypothetical protein J6S88_03065 [bacterium]|nr:hypothetical protein [bacterium]